MRLRGFLTRDVGTKIAALLLAVFLWVNVTEQRNMEIVLSLPVRYVNVPAGMTLASDVPTAARARVRGTGRFMRWKAKDVYFAVDLSPAERGTVTHVLSTAEAVIPGDRDVEVLEVVEPKAIKIDVDTLVTKKVPVRPVLAEDLGADRVLLGRASADPPEVTVVGARHLVKDLVALPTEPVDVNQFVKRNRVNVGLDFSGLPFVASEVSEVSVAARVEARKELGIPAVPIVPVAPAGLKARLTPETVDVVISGAASQVDSLDPRQVRLVLDVSGLPAGQSLLRAVPGSRGLDFQARPPGREGEGGAVLRVQAKLESPFDIRLVSASPEEIGLVVR